MTYREGLGPADRIAPQSDRLRMLRRIAEALDMPVADFYRCDPVLPDSNGPSTAECEAILTSFLRINDTEARRGIITLMRGYATN